MSVVESSRLASVIFRSVKYEISVLPVSFLKIAHRCVRLIPTGDAALVLSVFGLGGVLGGYLFRKFIYKTNQLAFLIALAFCIAGFFCVYFARSIAALYVSAVAFGCGFGIFVPVGMYYGGTSAGEQHRSQMVSYMNISNYLGGFLSVYIMTGIANLLNLNVARAHFLIGVAIFTLLLIAILIGCITRGRKSEQA